MTSGRIEKAIVLGIDGATLDLLEPWMDQGLLPTFRALRAAGACGRLRSPTPPVTAAAWASAVTGKNPGKHGIYGFRERHNRLNQVPRISSYSVRAARLWNILNHEGLSAGVANFPTMYPAEPMNGFSIAGHMASVDDLEYTYPASLRDELREVTGTSVLARVRPTSSLETVAGAVAFLDDVRAAFERHRAAFFHLWIRFDPVLLWYVLDLPGGILRFFWRYLVPGGPHYESALGGAIRARVCSCLEAVDSMIGEIWSRGSDRTDLYVLSASGYGPLDGWININAWLMQQGLLHLRARASRTRTLARVARVVWEGPALPRRARGPIRERFQARRRALTPSIDQAVDWSRTKAYCASLPGQGIYLCTSDRGEYEELRERLRSDLLQLRAPGDGGTLFDWVRFRDEVYWGDNLDLAPDIVFATRGHAYAGHPRLDVSAPFTPTHTSPAGFHRPEGLLFAVGPQIRPGCRVGGAVEDIAATLLHRLGLAVPDDFDGEVLTELFDPDWMAAHPVRGGSAADRHREAGAIYSESDEAIIAGRLRKLGYIE